jgi:hypothetical protein
VLIERKSLFVLHAAVAPLACRGRLSARDRHRKLERERLHGKRRSGSRAAVRSCFEALRAAHEPRRRVHVETDQKHSYGALLEQVFAGRADHETYSSRLARNRRNPLFQINHTLAMLRDGVSRLVRRTWAASKKRERLERHLWIWIAWRNYVRGITNRAPRTTPAMVLGLAGRRYRREELLAWRVLPAA